ncbi:MAG TPA: hypothetical protein VNA14_11830 [Mycobacteriales bacterium]|nr:hypothetical protein [Mycobacteriales bacterium]
MTTTVQEIVDELATVGSVESGTPHRRARFAAAALSVRYELVDDDGAVRPYVMRVDGDGCAIAEAGAAAAAEDIVIRTDPTTLHRVLTGGLSGRDAIVGGRLDIRRLPSMPKLLLMRSLFTRYQKTVRRG